MDNGTGSDRVSETVPTEDELMAMRRTLASALAQTERWLMNHYSMPREKRLLLTRRERRRNLDSNDCRRVD